MQVATLFRESATLLGASMESSSSSGSCNGSANCNANVGYSAGAGNAAVSASGMSGGGMSGGVMSSSGMSGAAAGLGTNNNSNGALDLKDMSTVSVAAAGSCSPREPVYTRPIDQQQQHRFKPVSAETQDDGYETSADLVMGGRVVPTGLEQMEDPYSFVDDEPSDGAHNGGPAMQMQPQIQQTYIHPNNLMMDPSNMVPVPRKRGRKKKIKLEDGSDMSIELTKIKAPVKERKKHDRFNGMPEEEVSKRTLPDHLTQNLDIIIIGINPGLFAAYKGHHYAGPGNHFWKCLYLSGLTPEQMSADEDYKLLQVGIGFTNMVQRATKGSADLTRKEIKEGSQILLEKLQHFKPKIAVFNGKLIYEVFSGKKDFSFGRQPDLVDGTNTYMWVMPSSSARCAQLPRAADKVPFYAALKKFRDYLNGMVAIIDDSEVVFSEARIKSCFDPELRSQYPMEIMDISNATVKREDNTTVVPCKKKRGRPKKIKVEGEEVVKPPPVKRVYNLTNQLNSDGTKKKRGRPKKVKPEDKPLDTLNMVDPSKAVSVTIRDVTALSPVQSPVNFCHLQQTPAYNMSNTPTPVQQPPAYMQSPRPQSQPFTHSDLSSEISAAISSEHLESPAPTSPSLDPPDFDPPTNMPTEDTTECCFSSPTPSTASEHPTPPMIRPITYPSYNTYSPDMGRPVKSEYKVQDMSTKSLSGLESLVDQIPSIAEGEVMAHNANAVLDHQHQHHHQQQQQEHQQQYHDVSAAPSATTPASFHLSYPGSNSLAVSSLANPNSFSVGGFASGYMNNGNNYSNLMSSAMHPFMEHHNCGGPQVPMPVPLSYHQLAPPYGQQYAGNYGVGPAPGGAAGVLHMPNPNYPNGYGYNGYGHTQPAAPAASYLANHMFDRIKPDSGYGTF